MKIEGGSELYKSQAKTILEIFNSVFQPEKEPSCTIKITPDIKRDIYLLSSEKEKKYYESFGVPDFNGFLSQPSPEDLAFIILVAEKQFADSQHVHTLIHELVHLHDYFRYYKENGNLCIKSKAEQDKCYYREFYYWSEFHAKSVGILIYAIYTYRIEYNLEAPPDGKYSFVLDFQTKALEESLDCFLSNSSPERRNDLFWDFVRNLVSYYGRLSIVDSKEPGAIPDPSFPRDKILKSFGKPAIDFFPLLKSMDSYEKAIPRLPLLKALFDQIIDKLNYVLSPWSIFDANLRDQIITLHSLIQNITQPLSQRTSMSFFIKKESNNSSSTERDSDKRR
jgi:hypothetical protein